MHYQKKLHAIAPNLNPAGIEAAMRIQYGTLDHLPHETFKDEARIAGIIESVSPGYLAKCADCVGMARDYAEWENNNKVDA